MIGNILNRLILSVFIRIYKFLGKFPFFNSSWIYILTGPLRGYKWLLHTSDWTYISGLYDPLTIKEIVKHVKPSNVIYDLGANEGYFTLVSAKIAEKNGTVYAFEPLPKNLRKLETHILINKIKNVIIIDKAVSNKNELLSFSNSDDMAGNTYINTSPHFNKSKNTITVSSVRLDDYIQEENIPLPDLIKIDVEGAEYDVLMGAAELINSKKPILILSTHDCHVPGIKESCLALLTKWGYTFSYINNYPGLDIGITDLVAQHTKR